MSVTFVAAGAAAAGTTSLSVPYPAGIAAGDLLVLAVANKYPANGPSTPSGFTAPANNRGTGGAGSNGVDTGSVYSTIYVKVADGTESGNLSVSIPSGNSSIGRMFAYRKTGSAWSWDFVCTNGADNSPGTSWAVLGAADPAVGAGDLVVVASGINTDAYTFSSQALSQTGITWGAATERQDSGTTQGQDCRLVVSDHVAASGVSTGSPTFTMTASGSSSNAPAGASVFLRVREIYNTSGTAAVSGGGGITGSTNKGGLGAGASFGGGAIAAVVLAGMLGVAQVLGGGSTAALGQKNGMSGGGSTQATITDDFNRQNEFGLLPPWDTNLTIQGGDTEVPSFALLSNGIQIVWANSGERNYAVFEAVGPSEDQEISADVVFGGGSGFDRRMKIIGRASVDPYSYNVIALVLSIDGQRYDIVWERSGQADVIIATAWFLGEITNARWGLRFTGNQIEVLKNGAVFGTHTDVHSDRTIGHGGVGAIQKNWFDQIEGRFDNFEFSYGTESPSAYVSGGGSVLATGMRATPTILSGGGQCVVSGYKGAFHAVSITAGGNVFADVRRSVFQEIVLNGGGAIALSAVKASSADLGISGGGVLIVTGSIPHYGTAAVHGGGSVAAGGNKVAHVAVVISGGGTPRIIATFHSDNFDRLDQILSSSSDWQELRSEGFRLAIKNQGVIGSDGQSYGYYDGRCLFQVMQPFLHGRVRAKVVKSTNAGTHSLLLRGVSRGINAYPRCWAFSYENQIASNRFFWGIKFWDASGAQYVVNQNWTPEGSGIIPDGTVLTFELDGTNPTKWAVYRDGVLFQSGIYTETEQAVAGFAGLISNSNPLICPNGDWDDFYVEEYGGGRKGSSADVLIFGGGILNVAARKSISVSVALAGGGAVSASGQEGVVRSVVLHGGGAAVLSGRKGALATVTASGGGTVTVTFVRSGGNTHDAYIPGGGRVIVYIRKEARAPPFGIEGGGTIRAGGVRIYAAVTLRAPEKKIPVTLVLVHLDFCTKTFGVAPCLATGTPCYNTWATCKYIPAFEKTDRIYRYSSADAPLPFDGHRPYVKSVKYLPTEIKTNLTVNARVTCEFVDEPDDDVDTDPYLLQRPPKPGTSFWKKLLARNPNYKGRYIEIFEGFLGDPQEEFVKKWVGKMENVSVQGNVVKIESADLLKDLSKIEVPPKLDIKLAIDVSAAQAEAMTVTDVSGLDPSGYVRVADEIIGYATLDGATKQLKVLTRGCFGTAAVDHKAKDKVQKVRYFAPANPWNILLEMLTVDAGIPEGYIDRESFTYAKEWPGGDVLFRAVISEPEKLDKLFFEIVDLLDAKAWVAEDLRITVKRNIQNEPGRLYYALTDDAHILHRSTSVDLNEKSRLSRMYVYWHKKALGKADDPFSYDRLDIGVDADAEGAFGDQVEKKLYCRWIDPVTVQEEVAQGYIKNLAMRQVRRNRTAQPIVTGALAIKDSALQTGQYVRLSTDEVLKADGSPVQAEIYQVVKREAKEDKILLSLICLSQRKVCFIAPAGTPNFAGASEVQKEYGFITNADGGMPDESPGYHIW